MKFFCAIYINRHVMLVRGSHSPLPGRLGGPIVQPQFARSSLPATSPVTRIAVVGGGFSGTLLTLHLLRRCPSPTRVTLIERSAQFGRGVAYGTTNVNHILNVPAGRMSAFQDQPDHFVKWLREQPADQRDGAEPDPHGFMPRRLYGAYVQGLLKKELERSGPDRLELLEGSVTEIDRTYRPLRLTLDRGEPIEVDIAVLAIGNLPPEKLPIGPREFYDTKFYRPDPWAPGALADLDPQASVLLVGTGLTAVDAVVSLLDHGHRGPIYALSRRGLLPRRHLIPDQLPLMDPAPFPTAINSLTRFLRLESERACAQGSTWQPIIDSVRPFIADLWQTMPLSDRRRFLRHLRPWWDIHRHRMANPVADRIDAARAGGQLRILAGRLRDVRPGDRHMEVLYQPRGQTEQAALTVDRVINCTGPGTNIERIADPLIRRLLHDGLIRPDPFRLGLDVTGNCALLSRNGAISRQLFAVGPITKGMFWENTAVPDIRRQTEKLAEHLAALIKSTPPLRVSQSAD